MHRDERDLLDVLKFELEFLEKGGYGRSPREPWRPHYIFEDSPTCMNYDCKDHPAPCTECVLMQLVPPEYRGYKIPCRHIPMTSTLETLDTMYRWSDDREIEDTVKTWLRETIAKLEDERTHPPAMGEIHTDKAVPGIALHQSLQPKCANPDCPNAFHWLAGGKFFRFHSDDAANVARKLGLDPTDKGHGVKHYWLCEHCARLFTLVYYKDSGVMLKLLWPELPVAESHKALPAA